MEPQRSPLACSRTTAAVRIVLRSVFPPTSAAHGSGWALRPGTLPPPSPLLWASFDCSISPLAPNFIRVGVVHRGWVRSVVEPRPVRLVSLMRFALHSQMPSDAQCYAPLVLRFSSNTAVFWCVIAVDRCMRFPSACEARRLCPRWVARALRRVGVGCYPAGPYSALFPVRRPLGPT